MEHVNCKVGKRLKKLKQGFRKEKKNLINTTLLMKSWKEALNTQLGFLNSKIVLRKPTFNLPNWKESFKN